LTIRAKRLAKAISKKESEWLLKINIGLSEKKQVLIVKKLKDIM
jgi:hypothetical protein